MTIAFGSDHAGFALKNALMEHVSSLGYAVHDYGCYDEKSTDYPIYGFLAGKAVSLGDCALGILVCGTGVGISLAANKVRGVRAVVCSEPFSAKMAREHNDANMLAIGARVVGSELANMIVDAFLDARFLGGRHARRVDMLSEIENTQDLAAAHTDK